ncbi:MAG: OmpA family protein [Bryobacterales bacterium]|nr:OmpA family protein [Bryobacterales bacterium]
MYQHRFVITTFASLALVSFTGCATKKYVNRTVAPIDQRVGAAERKAGEQGTQIEALENESSKTRERVGDLDNNLKQTNERVGQVDQKAGQAQQTATAAQQSASQAMSAANDAQNQAKAVGKYVDNITTYKMNKEGAVLFRSGSATLGDDGKKMLDDLASQVANQQRYVIEIQGFADATGNKYNNVLLSQRRADAVVRYLTVEHKIPLRFVHVLGVGAESPVADNKTRQGRSQNRRVEVRVFAPEAGSTAMNANPPAASSGVQQ